MMIDNTGLEAVGVWSSTIRVYRRNRLGVRIFGQRRSGQAFKGARGMPRHGQARKGVVSCEKHRGAARRR